MKTKICFFVVVMAVSVSAMADGDMFDSEEECVKTLLSDDFSFYEPKYFGLKNKNPVNGTTKVVAPLEQDACVYMLTVSGKKWVPQSDGTEFRFEKDANGNLKTVPYARNDCGNPVYGISYPSNVETPSARSQDQKQVAPTVQNVAQVRVGAQCFSPDGIRGVTGVDARGTFCAHCERSQRSNIRGDGTLECFKSTQSEPVRQAQQAPPGCFWDGPKLMCPRSNGYRSGGGNSWSPLLTGLAIGAVGVAISNKRRHRHHHHVPPGVVTHPAIPPGVVTH